MRRDFYWRLVTKRTWIFGPNAGSLKTRLTVAIVRGRKRMQTGNTARDQWCFPHCGCSIIWVCEGYSYSVVISVWATEATITGSNKQELDEVSGWTINRTELWTSDLEFCCRILKENGLRFLIALPIAACPFFLLSISRALWKLQQTICPNESKHLGCTIDAY